MQESSSGVISETKRFRMLFELSGKLVASLNLDKILQATVDGVTTIAGLETAALYTLEGDILQLRSTTPPLPPGFPDNLRSAVPVNHPNLCKSIATSSPVYYPDCTNEVLTPQEMEVIRFRNLRTVLFLPLITESEVIGALIVGSTGEVKPLTDEDIDLSHILANLAALAVKNARLYMAGQQYAGELENAIAESKHIEEEREALREQLIQARKMEAIGQLAGGVAHDFNNLLGGIMGNAELLKSSTTNEELLLYAKNIISITERSADLTAQLLAFSRKGKLQIEPIDLHTLIGEVVDICRHSLSKNIEIRTLLDASVCSTDGDVSQIQSALLNLAVNARDAMKEGGVLTISTGCTEVTGDACRIDTFEITPGTYIVLSVSDTGTGMDDQLINHIFEPFFTTKKKGEGTGMGLAAVYGTMKSHKGAIRIQSELCVGTTFTLYFPVRKRDGRTECDHAEKPSVSALDAPVNGTGEKIMVIDDEKMFADVAAIHLRKYGYTVETFNDSSEAMTYYEKHHDTVACVVLDMVMPKADGNVIFNAFKTIHPGVKVVLASGYSIDGAAQKLLDKGAKHFLQKPFHREELLHAVKAAIVG